MHFDNSAVISSGPSGAASAVVPKNTLWGVEGYHWKKLETLKVIQNG